MSFAQEQGFTISPSLAQEIEDAVMFGKTGDLDCVLNVIGDDGTFPSELRNGLEALKFFRAHYGCMELNPTDKKKVMLMDSAWSMELLNSVRAQDERAVRLA